MEYQAATERNTAIHTNLDESPENRSVAPRVRDGGVGLGVEGQLCILIVIVVTQTYTCDKLAHIYTHAQKQAHVNW